MPLPDIVLDDRKFDDLVRELRLRVPRYTPEWTDLNDSDPGITLVQLFAWLAEILLYRLNQVPAKNYLKFLELIGVQPSPPQPAHAELTFMLSSKDLSQAVPIPQGTQVSLAAASSGGPIIFETDDNLNAVGAALAALQSFDGAQFQIVTEANNVDGKYFYAFGPSPQLGAALYLGFDRAFPLGRMRLLAHAYTADLIAEGQGVSADAPTATLPVIANWEYWAGTTAGWRRLNVASDETACLTRTGYVQFDAPTDMQQTKYGLLQRAQDPALYWLRYRIDQVLGPGYEIPPRLEDVVINTIGATNAVTAADELLGASNGMPNQTFTLSHAPVLPGTLVLQLDEGRGFQTWKAVEDFAGCGPEDPCYMLDLASGTITFGDGVKGKIPLVLFPPPDGGAPPTDFAAGLANIKASTYRWGGGAQGNSGANTITSLITAIPYVDSVTNLRPSVLGQDAETLDSVKERAPQEIRSRSRAVTAEDFEFLATTTPGARIKRAKALPLYHPQFEPMRPPEQGVPATPLQIPGVVTVVVVPDSIASRPMPTNDTLQAVATWLKSHCLVTTELYVTAPRYRKVEIEAIVIAEPTAASGQVETALTTKLLRYFNPLTGGNDGAGWAFGGTVYYSDIYRQILDTPGVARLEAKDLTIIVDDVPMLGTQAQTDVALEVDQLVYSDHHTITVNYA